MADRVVPSAARMSYLSTFSSAYARVTALSDQRKYPEVLELVEQVLTSELFPVEQKDYFLYYRAVALDMTGQTLDALELFQSLRSRSLRASVVRSLDVVLHRLVQQVSELHDKNPADPALERYEAILSRLNFAPTFLTFTVRIQKAKALIQRARELEERANGVSDPSTKEGLIKEARSQRVKAEGMAARTSDGFLALSPNDPSYLRRSIELAVAALNVALRRKLLGRVHALFEERPFLTELAQILEDHDGSSTVSSRVPI